jgi:2-polyprenyl-6-methoxyphenol hydroxylase-like FAD-dependent oxidoreductase
MGRERGLTHHLGAYLAIYTVDNLLGLRDRAVLYNEPGRAAAMFTVRGNQHAKVVLPFRNPPLDIDFGDAAAQLDVLCRRFAGMGWYTSRLIDAAHQAYDFYFDEMSQVRLPRWSTGRVALLGDAAFGPSPMSGQGTSLAVIGAYLLAHHLADEHCRRRRLTCGKQSFGPTSSSIKPWPPTGCRHCCRRRGSASSCVTSR